MPCCSRKSTIFGPALMKASRLAGVVPGPWYLTTASRYWRARCGLSATPARFITGLSGTHQTPPEKPVEPPMSACFSTISARLPRRLATSAAHMEPPPLPTTTRS
jgi:hypothetical protein